jgi:Fe-S-cluster-containing dehydrogenase component
MQFGFVIDQRKCIGCHACTVACKAENDVPLGGFRTWVKYVEKGAFPSVRRHFTVLRCNHCDQAPCVEICPVTALHKRPDAIVDLDRDRCIGCRACMQACPYDALYFHADRGVAEKCHYCAHRTELGLEPACVIVCPAEAIVSGDVSDPQSRIARLIAAEPTSRRRLEKGTQPRLWYVDALPEALVPGKTAEPEAWLWAERATPPPPDAAHRAAGTTTTTTLDVAHPPAWGWHVWLYLVTKNVAAGAALAAPFLVFLGVRPGPVRDFGPELIALGFTAITGVLLVHDLGRPERAWRLLLTPNRRSWLVRGAWVLTAFAAAVVAALLLHWFGMPRAAFAARLVALPLAVLASGYSAWLFAQCRGRDLWLERGLFARLVLRAALLGAAVASLLPGSATTSAPRAAGLVLAVLALANALALQVELAPGRAPGSQPAPRGSDNAPRAQRLLARAAGRLPLVFAAAAVAAAGQALAPGAGWAVASAVVASVAIVIAMLAYERAWIRTGQAVPLS